MKVARTADDKSWGQSRPPAATGSDGELYFDVASADHHSRTVMSGDQVRSIHSLSSASRAVLLGISVLLLDSVAPIVTFRLLSWSFFNYRRNDFTGLLQFVTPCRVLVLGGSSGIGLAFATLIADEPGVEVRVTAPTADTRARAVTLLDSSVDVHVVNLLDDVEQSLRDLTVRTDVLVLCAGLEYVGPAQLEPSGAFAQMLTVNAAGPALAAKSCLPGMIERGTGLVIGLGSIVTSGPRPFLAGYTASKAALESYLASLAIEVQGTGVQIETLRLGPVATELGSNGPSNWLPDPASSYHSGFVAARAASESERAELMRTPADVAEELLGLVRRFRAERS